MSGRRGSAWLAFASACLALAACSGGGGGGDVGAAADGVVTTAPPGVLKVTVDDTFGTPIAGATVRGALGSSNRAGSTDAKGEALLLIDWPDGTADVTVSRATFVDKSVDAVIKTGTANQLRVTLDRATLAAGGSLTTRSGVLPSVGTDARELSFQIELVVVDGASRPIENLSGADFALQACTPDPASEKVECLRGMGPVGDLAYTPVSGTPTAWKLIPAGTVKPYAAALLLDQSGSIRQSDPTDARLFSAKAFLDGLGAEDRALLAAFSGGSDALIPTPPLATYAPARDRTSAKSYFPTLDGLAPLVGGDTPLYASLDVLRQTLVGDASLAGLAKAVVVFTDGADTTCGSAEACRVSREQSIQAARQDGVRLFTIGLSSGVDILALGELAHQTGGVLLYADNAEQLLPLYGSVGRLLSLGLPTHRLRWTVRASAAGAFVPGAALLGRVKVTTATGLFDVPFIVVVP